MSVRLNASADAGANCTLMVQEAPTARVAPQFGAPAGNVPEVTRENGCGVPPPKVKVPPARAVDPVFVTVRLWVLLVVPTAHSPKSPDPLTLALGAAPPQIKPLVMSTAPASTHGFDTLFLGLPKKSVLGAAA